MNNKTYDELYKEDIEKIKKAFSGKNIFYFQCDKEGEITIENAYCVNHYIQDFIPTILNPNILEKEAIQIIKKLMKNLHKNEDEKFYTNIGEINAKYCLIKDDDVCFYNKNKKIIAKFRKKILEYITDNNGCIWKNNY